MSLPPVFNFCLSLRFSKSTLCSVPQSQDKDTHTDISTCCTPSDVPCFTPCERLTVQLQYTEKRLANRGERVVCVGLRVEQKVRRT